MCRLPLGRPVSHGAVTKIKPILEIPAGRWWLPQYDFKQYGLSNLDWWRRTHIKRRLVVWPRGGVSDRRAKRNEWACSDVRNRRANTNSWAYSDIGDGRSKTNVGGSYYIWNWRVKTNGWSYGIVARW